MATQPTGPDFKVRDNFDPVAAAALISQKQEREQQMALKASEERRKKIQSLFDAITTGQQIANNSLELAEKRLRKEGIGEAVRVLGEKPPTASSTALPEKGEFPVQPSPEQEQSKKDRLAQAMLKINPDQYVKTANPNAQPLQDRFQQSALQGTDENGQPITVSTTFDKTTGQQINPLTGQPITSEEDLKGLLKRGFAQKMRPAGSTVDGREVVADERSGIKFVVSVDENGERKAEPYNGQIFPKLANAPAAVLDSIASLNQAKLQLQDINDSFSADFTGPLAGRVASVPLMLNSFSDEKRAEFVTQLNAYRNSMIKAITGAQMSEPEAARLMKQLPNEKLSPRAFYRQLQVAQRETERAIANKTRQYEKGGYVIDRSTGITPEKAEALFDRQLGKGLFGGGAGKPKAGKDLGDGFSYEVQP